MIEWIVIGRILASCVSLVSLVDYHLIAKPAASLGGELKVKIARKRFMVRTIPCSLAICLTSLGISYLTPDRFDLFLGIIFSLHFVLGLYLYRQINKEIERLLTSS